jgi:hypothetical protein
MNQIKMEAEIHQKRENLKKDTHDTSSYILGHVRGTTE